MNEAQSKPSNLVELESKKMIEATCNPPSHIQDMMPKVSNIPLSEKISDTKLGITPSGGAKRRSRWGPIHGTHEGKVDELKEDVTAGGGVHNPHLSCTNAESAVRSSDVDGRNALLQQMNTVEMKSKASGIACSGQIHSQATCVELSQKEKRRTLLNESKSPSPSNERMAAVQSDGLEQKSRPLHSMVETKTKGGDCIMLKMGRPFSENHSSKAGVNSSPAVAETLPNAADTLNLASTIPTIPEQEKGSAGEAATPRHTNFKVEFANKKPSVTTGSTAHLGAHAIQKPGDPLRDERMDCAAGCFIGKSAVDNAPPVSMHTIKPHQDVTTTSSLADSDKSILSESESCKLVEMKIDMQGVKNVTQVVINSTEV
jgi:hypothetical protein